MTFHAAHRQEAVDSVSPDRWSLYGKMIRSRLFEVAVAELWKAGLISGEMHLGTGEEAVNVGVVDHLADGDALALDHRGTGPLLMRGLDPIRLLREFLGEPGGLCAGQGGQMHLFSPDHLAASSGIVGASGPAAAGFALAARHLRPGKLAVAFFGEGAMNQGMLLESLNLAVVWRLPAVFVCKDDDWAIATVSTSVSGSGPALRARGFGLPVISVDGLDAEAVWHAARDVVERARQGGGPSFLHARCVHLDGHFLGDPLLEAARSPFRQWRRLTEPVLHAVTRRRGAPWLERLRTAGWITGLLRRSAEAHQTDDHDPIRRAREPLRAQDAARLDLLEARAAAEIGAALEAVAAAEAGR